MGNHPTVVGISQQLQKNLFFSLVVAIRVRQTTAPIPRGRAKRQSRRSLPGDFGEMRGVQIRPSGWSSRELLDFLKQVGIADSEVSGRFGLVAPTTFQAALNQFSLKLRDLFPQ